jgi:hypothetical protein
VQASPGQSEGVETPKAVPARCDEPGASELAQVPRSRRLGDIQDLHQIADAELAIAKEVQDAQPGPIGESLEERIYRFRSGHDCYIRRTEYRGKPD